MEKTEINEIYTEFNKLVNMGKAALQNWLKTEESKSVGWDSGNGESIGHQSGKHIVKILEKNKKDLNPADYEHMQKVNGYIKRHLVKNLKVIFLKPIGIIH